MRASDCNQLSNELVQQLYQHCLMFPYPPRKYNILLQCASFKTPKLEKKCIPQMIGFLLKFNLKMLFLGAQKGYPPWAVSPPQIKGRPPPISKTQPAAMNFLYACFRLQSSKQWTDSTTASTLPDLSSSTSQIYFLQCGNFKTPKLEKKRIPQMIDF